MEKVFHNNQKWLEKHLDEDSKFFKELSKRQTPKLLYIGCSDSRVTAEQLMGFGPGDVFIHRNIANLVPQQDLNAQSVVEYAVAHLKVKHVVVCGHYECGGIKAAMNGHDYGKLNLWLDNIKEVQEQHKEELDSIKDENDRYNRLVELNVEEQCLNLIKNTSVQKALDKGEIKIHGWVFDIQHGKLIDLELEFDSIM